MTTAAASIRRPQTAAVIYFADGLAQSALHRLLDAGELPNIERIFQRGGVEVRNAIVCLPSLTYANATSLITGLFPGHHGILGNQWFDPATLEFRDYGGPLTYRSVNHDIRHPTIYELLDDFFTLNVQCHTRKGVKHTIDQDVSSGILWALGQYEWVDRRVGGVLPRVERVIRGAGAWPIVWMNYFPGLDEIGHRFGPNSPQYASAIRNIDRQIGRIATFAQEKSGCEALYMALVTDHGMTHTARNRRHDAIVALRSAGLRIADGSQRKNWVHCDALALVGTDRCLQLHVRGEGGWGNPGSAEQIGHICERLRLGSLCGNQLICRRGGTDQVEIQSNAGNAIVERTGKGTAARFRYCVTVGQDPIHYADDPVIGGLQNGWFDSQSWLAASAGASNPDFVPQVIALFDSPRSGDIVSLASDNWSFAPRFPAGHGSCQASDMCVSHYYAGPGLAPGGKIKAARLVDVMPTVLDLLGLHERLSNLHVLDGASIRKALENA